MTGHEKHVFIVTISPREHDSQLRLDAVFQSLTATQIQKT